MKDNKITVGLLDVIRGYQKAMEEKNPIADELSKIFINETEDTIELDKNTPIVSFLLDKVEIKNQDITLEMLITNYVRAIYKNNSEIKKKLKKYILDYMKNIEQGIDNTYIIDLIKEDKNLYKYIKQVNNEEELEDYLIKNRKKQKENIIQLEKDIQFIKGKPYMN